MNPIDYHLFHEMTDSAGIFANDLHVS